MKWDYVIFVIFLPARIIVKSQFPLNDIMLFIVVNKSDEELRKRNEVKLFETLKRTEVRAIRGFL